MSTTDRHWKKWAELDPYPMERVVELFRRKMSTDFTGLSVDQGGHQGMMLIARKVAG